METKIKPATPLPFRAGTSGSHGLNKILDADGRVIGEASHYSIHCFEQRDYLIHAANAYPKLVEALRGAIRALEFNGLKADQYAAVSSYRIVLADLGEYEQ